MLEIRKKLRKVVAIAICLAGSATMFAQETGVVINGVTWATRNVGAPKTFVTNPEDAGMFYQWNGKIGWTSAGLPSDGTSTWNSAWNGNGATTWEAANDPCPPNWRVPTADEIDKLLAADKVSNKWITVNNITGMRSTDNATGASLFLPAAGERYNNGTLFGAGANGDYWSSTQSESSSDRAYELYFACHYISGVWIVFTGRSDLDGRSYGKTVRCVVCNQVGIDEVSPDTENAIVTGYFDILGRKLTEEPTKGIYIIQFDNGKTKKMMK